MKTIPYTKELKITNIESLPGGLKCNYLICINGPGGSLIAKQWKRKRPLTIAEHEILVTFKQRNS